MSELTPELRRHIDGMWKDMIHRKKERDENNGHMKMSDTAIKHMRHIPYGPYGDIGEGGNET